MNPVQRPLINEDWLSLWIGLFVFVLSLGLFADADILGWGIKTNIWNEFSLSITTVSKFYESLVCTWSHGFRSCKGNFN